MQGSLLRSELRPEELRLEEGLVDTKILIDSIVRQATPWPIAFWACSPG